MQRMFSLQANRLRRRMVEHLTNRFLLEMALKGSMGTDVMPVLSQMILEREAEDRAALWLLVKTPGFSYHSLNVWNSMKSSYFMNRSEKRSDALVGCKPLNVRYVSQNDRNRPLVVGINSTSSRISDRTWAKQ